MPRPEGRRCLVTSASGITVSRLRSGSLLHRFQSALPSGSQDTAGPANSFCILDCVFQEGKNTYYVMDLMCWRGMSFYDCAAEFRLFWVQQKLAETEGVLDAACNEGYRFSSVPSCWCSPSGFSAAVRCEVPFVQDGLYLLHMDGYYMPGQSPLALLWKDASCSRYFLDTDGEGNVGEFQQVTLVYQGDGSLATGDTPPVALGRLPEDLQSSLRHKLKAGKLLRCTIREQGIRTEYGQPLSADLRFEEFANQRRGHADTVGKVLFQHNARKGLISHDTVVAELQEQQRQTSAYDSSTKAMQETEHLQGC
ncbi:unnamed protein product [Ostreobium quekettii]|uniref:Snurportin-1 n=1 Tax=Ostreobium quekettii TaxID=121088 RepID=A0A8S1IND0_9CHLO|nr:unnamed protein product [Ostreobium quekettii]